MRRAVAGRVARAFGRDDEARLAGRLCSNGDAVIADVAACDNALISDTLLSSTAAPLRAPEFAPLASAPAHLK